MLNVEVYIYDDGTYKYERLDLYENESINMIDSIANTRDVANVFTAFTKSFAVPASKNNNIRFRHFYNSDISNGFDARVRVDALIKINGFDRYEGTIKMVDVKLMDGVAHSYSLNFYERTAKINAAIGRGKLKDLTYLSRFNHDYDAATVKTGFVSGLRYNGSSMVAATGTEDRNIRYPFISHTKQYFYDDGNTPKLYNGEDNLSLEFSQLKPAVRCYDIILAIEDTYGITFDKTGFLATDVFKFMYLWCHKDKGGLVQSDVNFSVTQASDYTYNAGSSDSNMLVGSSFPYIPYPGLGVTPYYNHSFAVTITGTGTWDVRIYERNNVYPALQYEEKNISGNKTIAINTEMVFPGQTSRPEIEIEAAGTITQINITLTTTRSTDSEVSVYDSANITPVDEVDIPFNMPDMSVMDFLTSLFKMYNLTIRLNADGEYEVETLDDFYTAGSTRDITQYVDPTSVTVLPATPYDSIKFMFEEAGTYLINKRYELLSEWYGNDEYDLNQLFDGGQYEVKVGFEKILFERMTDLATDSLTQILWAWCANDDGDGSYVGRPIHFFCDDSTFTNDANIVWNHDASISDVVPICSNTTIGTTPELTIGFKNEIDEYELFTLDDSLFSEYWQNYIEGIFAIDARIIRLTAVLPASFILQYSIADTIRYKNKEYFINEIDIDITTGEAEIELITKWL